MGALFQDRLAGLPSVLIDLGSSRAVVAVIFGEQKSVTVLKWITRKRLVKTEVSYVCSG
jgi:hypothetical protein